MKELFKKIWAFLQAVPATKYLLVIAGLVFAALFEITLHGKIEWCIAPVVGLCVIVAFVKAWKGKELDWRSYVAFLVGGFIIQLLAWI